ncbi:MAG TPA: hypothetical protein VMZ52_09140 [Bryobacteraceae bacterium]|nr:hypothetical protein [Bryobacteraceae bacterium]
MATGPVDRVWYSADGATLTARTHSGRIFETSDFEHWRLAQKPETPPEDVISAPPTHPENAVQIKAQPARPGRLFAAGRDAYRSDDGGLSWVNVTNYKGTSILGESLSDLAVSPVNSDEVVVAGRRGIWRSMDAGLSWTGLNQLLPNLPIHSIVRVGDSSGALQIATGDGEDVVEWRAGENSGWRPAEHPSTDLQQRREASRLLGIGITAIAKSGDSIYAGAADGSLRSSSDQGRSWRIRETDGGTVERIYLDAKDPLVALAVTNSKQRSHVLRTLNGGQFWDDLTANLPNAPLHAIVAERTTGALYVAGDLGVYMTIADLQAAGPATPWSRLRAERALDVALDAAGNQLYVALDGFGIYAAMAPHRLLDPRVVSSADMTARPAAPGSLISVVGSRVLSARAGQWNAPVLAVSDTESQIQVPFEVAGSSLSLALQSPRGTISVGLPLREVSPSIFIDKESNALVMNADSGLVLNAATPAHSGTRLQILAAGLGRVRPEWPTGLAAPLEDAPKVIAPVRLYLDREPLPVTRATLAPGYIGLYLLEVQLPSIVNSGPAELYIESDGQQSNRVQVYLEP